jgi:hypothetical protein
MSDTTGTEDTVREAYAFVCVSCGHGWEQAYEIEHHVDLRNHPYVTYIADGRRVPSPLTRPACENCEGHRIRIMRAGQVSAMVPRQRDRDAPREQAVRPRRNWSPLSLLHRRSRENPEDREERESA